MALAALAVGSPEASLATVSWWLMLWGGPVGFVIGAALGLTTRGSTRSLMTLRFVRRPAARVAVALLPAAINAAIAYVSLASVRPMIVAAATVIGGALGLLCGAMEASAASWRGQESPR